MRSLVEPLAAPDRGNDKARSGSTGAAPNRRRASTVAEDDQAGRITAPADCRLQFPASTAIEIGTPLVKTSKTAERARDWSTISRSFSGAASLLILKLTRIP
jgi:hypothetical protein